MCVSGWGTGRKAKHEIGRRAAALKLKLAQWAMENSPYPFASPSCSLFKKLRETPITDRPSLSILLLSDKMNCIVGFVNCLLRVPLHGVPALLSRQ